MELFNLIWFSVMRVKTATVPQFWAQFKSNRIWSRFNSHINYDGSNDLNIYKNQNSTISLYQAKVFYKQSAF